MKKKSFIAKAFIAASVIPCALVMTGCGASQLDTFASVDKGGSYEDTTVSAMSDFVALEETKDTIAGGYHMSMETKAQGQSLFMNAYLLMDENGVPTASAMKFEMPTTHTKMNMWVKDGVLYSEITQGDLVTKTYTNLGLTGDASDIFEYGTDPMISANEFLSNFEDISIDHDGNFKFKVAKSGTTVKYNAQLSEGFELEVAELGATYEYKGADFYVIYENNQFVGASFETNFKITLGGKEYDSSSKMAVTTFDGEIDYPNFTDFKNLNPLLG